MTEVFASSFVDEPDFVEIRKVVRSVTRELAFDYHGQIRIATGVSELVRVAFGEKGGTVGVVLKVLQDTEANHLQIEVAGPGLAEEEQHRPGASSAAAQKLLGHFEWSRSEGGARCILRAALPATEAPITAGRLDALRAELAPWRTGGHDGYREEIDRQTRELAATLLELERKQQELLRLNAELNDTNRGVVALYAELDERADHLRRADELKTRFFSYISHEFRTPLSSIVALGRLLLERTDGDLAPEQEKQVRLIRDSAADLLDLVSDLLDLAKAGAGKVDVTVTRFSLGALFGALRAMMRPLLVSSHVQLHFDEVGAVPPIISDEGKISQILRNFLANAVKFTERGSISVSAKVVTAGERAAEDREPLDADSVLFCVADTGIGISPGDQERIFDEFAQVRHGLQREYRGTGLGLPLCNRLASLLGGEVWVHSEVGKGSRFYCLVPRVLQMAATHGVAQATGGMPLLLVSARPEQRAALENAFAPTPFDAVAVGPAELTTERIEALGVRVAIVDGSVEPEYVERLRGAAISIVDAPLQLDAPHELVQAAYRAVAPGGVKRVLVVDDDPRYLALLTRSLQPLCEEVVATGDPVGALATVEAGGIDCAVVDLMMPDMDGFEVLRRLRANAASRDLPIVICSSKALTHNERALLRGFRTAFVAKDGLAPDRLETGLMEARLCAAGVAEAGETADGSAAG